MQVGTTVEDPIWLVLEHLHPRFRPSRNLTMQGIEQRVAPSEPGPTIRYQDAEVNEDPLPRQHSRIKPRTHQVVQGAKPRRARRTHATAVPIAAATFNRPK